MCKLVPTCVKVKEEELALATFICHMTTKVLVEAKKKKKE